MYLHDTRTHKHPHTHLSAKIQLLNKDVWEARLASLEQQAIADFQKAIREFSAEGSTPVLTTALIAGDQGKFPEKSLNWQNGFLNWL